jgi:fatty-acyl-CoA synthase
VPRPGHEALDTGALIGWMHQHLAAYKCPRLVQLVPSLPRSPSGKVMWRLLQDEERAGGGPSSCP